MLLPLTVPLRLTLHITFQMRAWVRPSNLPIGEIAMYEIGRYSRVPVIPGETYTCGCAYRGPHTVLIPEARVVDKKTCPTHGCPVATEADVRKVDP